MCNIKHTDWVIDEMKPGVELEMHVIGIYISFFKQKKTNLLYIFFHTRKKKNKNKKNY